MKKYYLIAIEEDDPDAMFALGLYYQNIEKDYKQMQKYYLMAINKGHYFAKVNLQLCRYI
jgi:TPR repeat protein